MQDVLMEFNNTTCFYIELYIFVQPSDIGCTLQSISNIYLTVLGLPQQQY